MKLKVTNIQPQTEFAKEITFEIPHEAKEQYRYKSGQYITLSFQLNGEEVRRSYSICSTPNEETLRIGVKRVKGGLVSNHINDNVRIGDLIEVLPPDGRFFADVKPNNYKTYYLFAGGSGITPVISILKNVLNNEKNSFVTMIYANRNQDTIMFQEELEALQAKFSERFILVHYLSQPKTNWLKKETLQFEKGYVDNDAIQALMSKYPPYAQNVEYYICGPEKMRDGIINALQNVDVPLNRIFIESFGTTETTKELIGIENAILKATLNGKTISTTIAKGKTILRALIENGNNPPYSCEGGVCGKCACKLKQGEVAMKKNMVLTEEELKNGFVLSCQSIPMSNEIEVNFE